jgi:hypothetical protein
MQCTTRNIFKVIEKKNERRQETFKVVMKKCITFIERNVAINNLNCFYQVPEFIVGHSMYNLEECITYLTMELKDGGFIVKYFFPNILYISWNKLELLNNGKEKQKKQKLLVNENNSLQEKPSGKFVLNL